MTQVGANMGTGRNVQLSVVEVLKPDPEPASTLPRVMEEQTVREMLKRNNPVTVNLVRV